MNRVTVTYTPAYDRGPRRVGPLRIGPRIIIVVVRGWVGGGLPRRRGWQRRRRPSRQRQHDRLGLLVGLGAELSKMLLKLPVHAPRHVIPPHVGEVPHEAAVDVFAIRVDDAGPLQSLHGPGEVAFRAENGAEFTETIDGAAPQVLAYGFGPLIWRAGQRLAGDQLGCCEQGLSAARRVRLTRCEGHGGIEPPK